MGKKIFGLIDTDFNTLFDRLFTGIILVLIGTLVSYVMFNALFIPTNEAVGQINGSLVSAGYESEAQIAITAWQIILLGVPLGIVAVGVILIGSAFKFPNV